MRATVSSRTRSILVVDDDPRCRHLIREIVDRGADAFHEGSEGGEAVTLFREHRPDLVIIDVEMKPLDGLSATQAILAMSPEATVIVVSQFDGTAMVSAAAAAGARHFVSKTQLLSLRGVLDELFSPAS